MNLHEAIERLSNVEGAEYVALGLLGARALDELLHAARWVASLVEPCPDCGVVPSDELLTIIERGVGHHYYNEAVAGEFIDSLLAATGGTKHQSRIPSKDDLGWGITRHADEDAATGGTDE